MAERVEEIKQLPDSDKEKQELLDALDAWGRSPDAEGNRGQDGKGFNAGVIHFFAYRGNGEKNGRYRNEKEPFSLQSFINNAKKLRGLIEMNTDDTDYGAIIKDEKGQKRLLILTKKGELVVGFQRVNEPMRVISVYPKQNLSIIERKIREELSPPLQAKQRLNELGGNRQLEMSLGPLH
jgi:hypothetical protein